MFYSKRHNLEKQNIALSPFFMSFISFIFFTFAAYKLFVPINIHTLIHRKTLFCFCYFFKLAVDAKIHILCQRL